MSSLVGPNGQPLDRKITGKLAMRIMVEEIGEAIGAKRIPAFERKVREELAKTHPRGGSFHDWLNAMARVIVDNDDKKADQGFIKGVRRIRAMGGQL